MVLGFKSFTCKCKQRPSFHAADLGQPAVQLKDRRRMEGGGIRHGLLILQPWFSLQQNSSHILHAGQRKDPCAPGFNNAIAHYIKIPRCCSSENHEMIAASVTPPLVSGVLFQPFHQLFAMCLSLLLFKLPPPALAAMSRDHTRRFTMTSEATQMCMGEVRDAGAGDSLSVFLFFFS